MAYNVLIVEDQGIPRDLFEIYIRGSGQFHHLLSIPNASAALSVCQSSRVDLILMDVMTELGHRICAPSPSCSHTASAASGATAVA